MFVNHQKCGSNHFAKNVYHILWDLIHNVKKRFHSVRHSTKEPYYAVHGYQWIRSELKTPYDLGDVYRHPNHMAFSFQGEESTVKPHMVISISFVATSNGICPFVWPYNLKFIKFLPFQLSFTCRFMSKLSENFGSNKNQDDICIVIWEGGGGGGGGGVRGDLFRDPSWSVASCWCNATPRKTNSLPLAWDMSITSGVTDKYAARVPVPSPC